MMKLKVFKLRVHQQDFSGDEILVNPKDFPNVKVGDVVEIYHADDDSSRLLLQLKSMKEDFQQKDSVSVAKVIVNSFNLRMYTDVHVNVVNPRDVGLDLVELTYKEQYFSRADMWRLRKILIGGCLYTTKVVEFAGMRAQVEILWSKGEKVTSGYVTDETKVTYRSSTAQVNIFIQMSSEMWEFDNYGDLYFEKAVDGFLLELFEEWLEKNCNHDVTITMFSRNYYDAQSIEEFPMNMRECVQQDYIGRFYEDFYRVVVQNERYDEWTNTVIKIKTLFKEYQDKVVDYHQRPGVTVPRAYNSTAVQGNFLEVLNMALNAFEKYYLDRCFDRTGKLSIVVTPGAGVFDVDRQLTNVTKHRTIDCGNSSDLVCMGEQPLHAVPLFKFHNKNPTRTLDVGDEYNIPHWINHSFYTSRVQNERVNKGLFIPRIKMPHSVGKRCSPPSCNGLTTSGDRVTTAAPSIHCGVPFVDYEEYDAQVFKIASNRPNNLMRMTESSAQWNSQDVLKKPRHRVQYAANTVGLFPETPPVCELGQGQDHRQSRPIGVPRSRPAQEYLPHTYGGNEADKRAKATRSRGLAESCGSPAAYQSRKSLYSFQARRALINPFTPSRLHFKVTAHRRRWAHAFPTDPQGAAIQLHHSNKQSMASLPAENGFSSSDGVPPPTKEVMQAAQLAVDKRRQRSYKVSESSDATDRISIGRVKTMTVSSGDSFGSADSLKDYSVLRERDRDRERDRERERETSVSFGKELTKVSSSGMLSLTAVDSTSSFNSALHGYERDGLPGSAGSMSRSRHPSLVQYSRSWSSHRDLSGLLVSTDGHNWLWGITGEQEWTPEMKTGVDWKSMTMPASLPITTDYFPDNSRLETEFVFKNYHLLPDDVNMDRNQRPSGRQSMTAMAVYKEMVAQRLAQGFQLVILPKPPATTPGSTISSSPYPSTPGFLRRSRSEPTEETILSIGRIFHRLALNGPKISVTTYWPRHPYPQLSYHYTYRFQVPDSENYDVSWTDFCTEELEKYNWNYVDSYLCTQGEDDFGLQESLKYWRSRFFLIPCNNPATKKIIEGSPVCDIYREHTPAERDQLVDGYLRFIEILNKIRRPVQARMPPKPQKELTRRASFTQSPVVGVTDKMAAEVRGQSDLTPIKVKTMSKITDAESSQTGSSSTPGSVSELHHRRGASASHQMSTGQGGEGSGTPVQHVMSPLANPDRAAAALFLTSPLPDILNAMLDPSEGLYFIKSPQTPGVPPVPKNTFVAAEATSWALSHIRDLDNTRDAVQLFQRMIDEQLVCHVSGNMRHQFVYGFYLYVIIDRKNPGLQYFFCAGRDLCEIEVLLPEKGQGQAGPPVTFLEETLPEQLELSMPTVSDLDRRSSQALFTDSPSKRSISSGTPELTLDLSALKHESRLYKLVNVDVDPTEKSDRPEWGTARYHAHYTPDTVFELEVQWLVATGCIMGELVQTWARKAGSCGFHFLPVPCDPFALPFTDHSDPLRGPIFVPLNVECLLEPGKELFEEFAPHTREERQLLLQESILRRFGFMPDKCPVARVTSATFHEGTQPHYVHCSGGMFVMIPDTKTSSPRNRDGTHRKVAVGSYKKYIAFQSCLMDNATTSFPMTTGSDADSGAAGAGGQGSSFYQVGFLWTWNYMLAKLWRSSHTGDEQFQDKMLADFRAFCANADNRLKRYWEECYSARMRFDDRHFDAVLPEEGVQFREHWPGELVIDSKSDASGGANAPS